MMHVNVRGLRSTLRRWLSVASLWGVYGAIAHAQDSVAASPPSVPSLPIAPLPASPLPSAGPRVVPPKLPLLLVVEDTSISDSLRTIIERDWTFGDRLDVIVLDSASRGQMGAFARDSSATETSTTDSILAAARQFNAAFVVRVRRRPNSISASVFDVAKGTRLRRMTMETLWDDFGMIPRIEAHRLADQVEAWVTGVPGIAATRIAYVLDDVIHVIDSDGANDYPVTTGGVSLSPAWHPRGTALVYSDLTDAGTQIVKIDLVTGQHQVFTASKRGLNITPVFTPRGDSIVYASASVRGSRLMIASASGKGKARVIPMQSAALFHDIAAPVFSPDGKRIAFVASSPLYPQVYTMDRNGAHVKRLVPPSPNLRNERTAPDWSPDGSTIIYQQQNRKFQVWAAHLAGGIADTVTRITDQAENEDPAWAPDSRHIVLTSNRGGEKELWVLDTYTGRWRQLTSTPGARLASWSPRLGWHGGTP